MNVKPAFLMTVLFLMILISGCVQEGDAPNSINTENSGDSNASNQSNPNQDKTPIVSGDTEICDQTCIDFCKANPGSPGPRWEELTPAGSTENCKTIIERELGIPDLGTCEECKCMCFSGTEHI